MSKFRRFLVMLLTVGLFFVPASLSQSMIAHADTQDDLAAALAWADTQLNDSGLAPNPTGADSYAITMKLLMAHAAAGDLCTPKHKEIMTALEDFIKNNPDEPFDNAARVGMIAIYATTIGADPTNYAEHNLIKLMQTNPETGKPTTPEDPAFNYGNFALGGYIIGLVRTGTPVPGEFIDKLIANGDGQYNTADTLSMMNAALVALKTTDLADKKAAVDAALTKYVQKALAEFKVPNTKTRVGKYVDSYSPVQSTGLAVGALNSAKPYLSSELQAQIDQATKDAQTFMKHEQVPDKGWSNRKIRDTKQPESPRLTDWGTDHSGLDVWTTVEGSFGYSLKHYFTIPMLSKLTINTQPADTTVDAGQAASFAVEHTGSSVQWQTSADGTQWTDIPDATKNELSVPTSDTSLNGHKYRAVITQDCTGQTVTSEPATLTVNAKTPEPEQPAPEPEQPAPEPDKPAPEPDKPAPQPPVAEPAVELISQTDERVDLMATGFKANAPVSITINKADGTKITVNMGEATFDENGERALYFETTKLPAGDYTATVSDGTNTADLSFTVKAAPANDDKDNADDGKKPDPAKKPVKDKGLPKTGAAGSPLGLLALAALLAVGTARARKVRS